jgi:hypothetical protein
LALIRGAIVMSTVMEVLVLSLCECPIGIPWFQNDAPFHNLIHFIELAQSISPKIDAHAEVGSVVGWVERKFRSWSLSVWRSFSLSSSHLVLAWGASYSQGSWFRAAWMPNDPCLNAPLGVVLFFPPFSVLWTRNSAESGCIWSLEAL